MAGFPSDSRGFPYLNYGDGSTTRSGLPFRIVSTGPAWLPSQQMCKMGVLQPFLLLPVVEADPAAGLHPNSDA